MKVESYHYEWRRDKARQEQRGDVGGHRCSVSPKTIAWKVAKHDPASCQAFVDSPVFRALKTTTIGPIRMDVMVESIEIGWRFPSESSGGLRRNRQRARSRKEIVAK